MSDLRPQGVKVNLDGVEREFLFTMNAIEEIQSKYGKTVLDVLTEISDQEKMPETIKSITSILLTDEAERKKWKDPDSTLPSVSEKEAGWMVTADNIDEVTVAILRAYRISIPEPDEDENPNGKSSQSH